MEESTTQKRWCELDAQEKLAYRRSTAARHRAKKREANPSRQPIDTPKAAANREKAKRAYDKKKRLDEAATLEAGREHQRKLRLKKDGGPIGRLMKNAIKNVLRPYVQEDQTTKRRVWNNDYRRGRYSSDEVYRFRCRLRVRLVTYLRTTGNPVAKEDATADMVVKPADELLAELEEESGLTAADSEVDHVFPLAKYNLGDVGNVNKVMHWSNFQLLTSHENKWKNDRLPTKAMAAKVERWAWPDDITEDMLPTIYPGWSTPLRM